MPAKGKALARGRRTLAKARTPARARAGRRPTRRSNASPSAAARSRNFNDAACMTLGTAGDCGALCSPKRDRAELIGDLAVPVNRMQASLAAPVCRRCADNQGRQTHDQAYRVRDGRRHLCRQHARHRCARRRREVQRRQRVQRPERLQDGLVILQGPERLQGPGLCRNHGRRELHRSGRQGDPVSRAATELATDTAGHRSVRCF